MLEDDEVERYSMIDKSESSKGRWIHAIKEWISSLEKDGYKLFSMSITYKTSRELNHSQKFLSEIFKNLYWHQLLPKKIFKNKKWIKKSKGDQPVVLLFVEEHQEKGVKTYNPKMMGGFEYDFPERLHHHAILAVRPEHESVMKSLCFENSLREFSPWVLTSDIQSADLGWIDYVAKDLELSSDRYEFYGPEELEKHVID